jgi:hypothetical protein
MLRMYGELEQIHQFDLYIGAPEEIRRTFSCM